jgi:hypothetical protein
MVIDLLAQVMDSEDQTLELLATNEGERSIVAGWLGGRSEAVTFGGEGHKESFLLIGLKLVKGQGDIAATGGDGDFDFKVFHRIVPLKRVLFSGGGWCFF